MAAPDQFVDELGVTAVNAAQIEETLLHKVIGPMVPGCAANLVVMLYFTAVPDRVFGLLTPCTSVGSAGHATGRWFFGG